METISITEAIVTVSGNNSYQFKLLFFCGLVQFMYSCFVQGIHFMLPNHFYPYTATYSFELIEADSYWTSLIVSTFFLGVTIGSVYLTWFSDKYGRKHCFKSACRWYIIFLIFTAISLSRIMLILCAFFLGIFLQSGFSIVLVLLIESVKTKSRLFMSCILTIFVSFGVIYDGIMYYFQVNWRINVGIGAFMLIFMYFSVDSIHESPRFMVARNRIEEAETILNKISIQNGKGEFLHKIKKENYKEVTNYSYFPFFKPLLLKKTIVGSVLWLNSSCFIYAMMYSKISLHQNEYLNSVYLGLLEIFSLILSLFIGNRFERKTVFYFGIIFSRLSLIISLFSEQSSAFCTIFYSFTQIGASIEYFFMYLISIENFPTYCRNKAFGVFTIFRRFGQILIQILTFLAISMNISPTLLISLFCLTSLIAVYYSQETSTKDLEDFSSLNRPQEILLIDRS